MLVIQVQSKEYDIDKNHNSCTNFEILTIVLPSGTIDLMKMNGQIKEQAEAPFLLHKHKSATLNAATATLPPYATAAFVSWNGFSLRLGRGGRMSSGAVADYSQLRRQNMLGRGSRNGSGVAKAAESARARQAEFAPTRRAEKARARRQNLPPPPPT